MADELHEKLTDLVTEVLKNRNFDKLNVEFPEYDPTGGYAAEMIFAKVTGEKNGSVENLNMIIKKSRDSAIIQDSLNLKQAYISEINMYSKFIPYLDKFAREKNTERFENIPQCYGTITRENLYIVFLENLKLSGFRVHDIEMPLDLSHTKLVVEAYAKLHAFCFALKDQEPKIFDEFKQCSNTFFVTGSKAFDCLIATIRKELENVIQIYEVKNRSLLVGKLKLMHENYEDVFRDCTNNRDEDYLVIRHGDCWNNNYLFHYNEDETISDEVKIIDWQFGIFGSPLADLCTFLFYCCSRIELEHLDELLEMYYDTLSNKLKELGSEAEKCFPKEEMQKSFRRYALLGIAGMPISVKLGCQVKIDKTFDIAKAVEDGNFNSLISGPIKEEKYFNRINGVYELCIERGLI